MKKVIAIAILLPVLALYAHLHWELDDKFYAFKAARIHTSPKRSGMMKVEPGVYAVKFDSSHAMLGRLKSADQPKVWIGEGFQVFWRGYEFKTALFTIECISDPFADCDTAAMERSWLAFVERFDAEESAGT